MNSIEIRKDYERIALPFMPYIFKLAYRMSRNRETAEDLTQETFLIAMRKFHQLKDRAKCRSWLSVILKNLYIGLIEKRKGRQFLDYDDLAYGIPDQTNETVSLWREGFSDLVQSQLDRLDIKYKTPLVMSVLGNYSYREISDHLDIPIGTVMSRLHRGKSFLRRELINKGGLDKQSDHNRVEMVAGL